MLVIPAIDLMDGRIVRLKKGIMEDPTVYNEDLLDTAKRFADMGAKRLHIVDLNGARSGENGNYKQIEAIATKSEMEVEVGGGIRNMSRLKDFMNMGVKYAILGTVTVKDPDFTGEALETFPDRIILGLDAKKGKVVVEGWYETSDLTISQVLEKYAHLKAESVIITDIDKDGMLEGVNIEMVDRTASISPFPVIASGGVSSLQDIIKLKELANPNIKGCITGKAVYEGKIDLREAFLL